VSRLFSIQEVAERLGVSVYTVRRLAQAGELQIVRVGRRVLLVEADVQRAVREGCSFKQGQSGGSRTSDPNLQREANSGSQVWDQTSGDDIG
jgi:excisionase family DNA binding protein